MKVLITSPSLNENENVSGISTMISSVIANSDCKFSHFAAGRKDGEKTGLRWLVAQSQLPFSFRTAIASAKPDVIHINTALEPRSIVRDAILARLAKKFPLVVHVHGGRFALDQVPPPWINLAANDLLRSARRVVVLSDEEAESLSKRVPGIEVSVLPNAIATGAFPETDRPRGPKSITYLGRLTEAKGLSEIVETCRLLRGQGFKFKFVAYGAGQDQNEFIRRMTQVLGEDFYYGGIVSGAEKVKALCAADIFLMPSRFEGLSLALLEAMAAGCVPVVSARGSIPSVVEDGRNGFLVDPGDITQIVGRLKFLLSEGETGWHEYRRNARETVRTEFDLKNYVVKLKEIYNETLATK
jgi:glycosyltransferase involved in cell wall biosynthesis